MPRTTSFQLGPELERVVARHLHTGRFATASEVVRAGLRALDAEDARTRARLQALEEGRSYGLPTEELDFEPDEPAQSDLRQASEALREVAGATRLRSVADKAGSEELLTRTASCNRVAGWLDGRVQRRLLVLRLLTAADTSEGMTS